MGFKNFLLNENAAYLAQRVGDVLSGLHELEENAQSMGTRQLMSGTERTVNQIRRILHSHWDVKEQKYLKRLQKVAVALMKAIEDKDDLKAVIASAAHELEAVTSDLGMPQNDLGTSAEMEPDAQPDEAEENPQPQQEPGQEPTPSDVPNTAQSPI